MIVIIFKGKLTIIAEALRSNYFPGQNTNELYLCQHGYVINSNAITIVPENEVVEIGNIASDLKVEHLQINRKHMKIYLHNENENKKDNSPTYYLTTTSLGRKLTENDARIYQFDSKANSIMRRATRQIAKQPFTHDELVAYVIYWMRANANFHKSMVTRTISLDDLYANLEKYPDTEELVDWECKLLEPEIDVRTLTYEDIPSIF